MEIIRRQEMDPNLFKKRRRRNQDKKKEEYTVAAILESEDS